ncbi:hypothetical protein N7517_009669 [Penicillium concentricum]|uniref:C2H2-type domain-containing protein n=1 Tax=Penicillium concentricum TaxID=293559 RepID=A0A9W9RMV2_9EURO|nr:uncharacterized protein N7517_009669 [Penicillium concentricum]KAJ5360478.1 hypothetical protein N7517_009669 [Penicillium concentricum]
MSRSPDETNLKDLNMDLLFELGWYPADSVYPQHLLARRSAAVIGTYTPPADQPEYHRYEEPLTMLGEGFTPTSPSTHRWPNQSTTQSPHSPYSAVNNNGHRGLATTIRGSVDCITPPTPLVASSSMYPQQNQSTAQYFRALAPAFDDMAEYTTRTAPPMDFSPGQVSPSQEPSHSRVIAPGAIRNALTNSAAPPVHTHGSEIHNPSPIFRCDQPDCTYRGTFSVKGSLTRHRTEQHTAPRSFPCPSIGCDRTYSRKCHLNDHRLKVHGIRG